jgi:hypothetical protein
MGAPTARQQFRDALAQLATKTQAKLPQLNGRVERACKLVLHGDVELREDRSALVGSLSDPAKAYQISQGVCQCKDYTQAPEHLCCHKLAAGFLRKINEVLDSEAPQAPANQGYHGNPEPSQVPLPEAPSSINFKAIIGGFETQITLRDADESRLLARLQALLKDQRIRPVPKPAPRQGQQWRSKREYR